MKHASIYPRQAERFLVTVTDKTARNAAMRTLKALGHSEFPAVAPVADKIAA